MLENNRIFKGLVILLIAIGAYGLGKIVEQSNSPDSLAEKSLKTKNNVLAVTTTPGSPPAELKSVAAQRSNSEKLTDNTETVSDVGATMKPIPFAEIAEIEDPELRFAIERHQQSLFPELWPDDAEVNREHYDQLRVQADAHAQSLDPNYFEPSPLPSQDLVELADRQDRRLTGSSYENEGGISAQQQEQLAEIVDSHEKTLNPPSQPENYNENMSEEHLRLLKIVEAHQASLPADPDQ